MCIKLAFSGGVEVGVGEVGDGGGGVMSGEVTEEGTGWRWGWERWVMEGGVMSGEVTEEGTGWRWGWERWVMEGGVMSGEVTEEGTGWRWGWERWVMEGGGDERGGH